VVYPRPKSFIESVMKRRGAENSEKEAVGQTLARILEEVQPVARQLDAIGIKSKDKNDEQDDVLRMNPVEISQ
jgi:hypothetical protein